MSATSQYLAQRIAAVGIFLLLTCSPTVSIARCTLIDEMALLQRVLADFHLDGPTETASTTFRQIQPRLSFHDTHPALAKLAANADISDIKAIYDLLEISQIYKTLSVSAAPNKATAFIRGGDSRNTLHDAARRITRMQCVQANLNLRVIAIKLPVHTGATNENAGIAKTKRPQCDAL